MKRSKSPVQRGHDNMDRIRYELFARWSLVYEVAGRGLYAALGACVGLLAYVS